MSDENRVLYYARKYMHWGWSVVPIPRKQKAPRIQNWPNLRLTETDLPQYFHGDANIGVLLGDRSGGLIDVDMDSPQALFLGRFFLPDTGRIHGRTSKPRSHHWYRTRPALRPEKFCDLDGTCLLELRSNGQQTIVPPSLHPCGERIRWESRHHATRVDGKELQRAVALTATAAFLARHWPTQGSRNETALALAGTLLRAGWDEIEVGDFVSWIAQAADDEEWAVRKAVARTTKKKLDSDRAATGRPRLSELLGSAVVDRACEWLDIGQSRRPLASVGSAETGWPDLLAKDAFYGLAGQIVQKIGPHTEADPAALLVQFLTGLGNVIGRHAHFKIGASPHYSNLFCILVGRTAKSRKGTAWAEVGRLFEEVDSEWCGRRVLPGGLSSGEGLIWEERDPIEKHKRVRKGGRQVDNETVIEDRGVADKRLFVLETEFGSPLRVIRREGNTLSAVIRNAWDRGNLSTLTKNSPARATGAHISITGHITRGELLREFTANEGSNGFANRFLWVCVRRARLLPLGGRVPSEDLCEIAKRLHKAVEYARHAGELTFSKSAERLWCKTYKQLAAEVPGLLGAITSRAEAQVLRLSMIYALLSRSSVIKTYHLRAALAVWRYCEDSARYIFGDAFGDPVVDQLLASLRKSPKGLTRTEIREIFSRNRSEAEINSALRLLDEYGLVRYEREETGGRPSERWFATR